MLAMVTAMVVIGWYSASTPDHPAAGQPPTVPDPIARFASLSPHDPISIVGNAGFAGPNATTGVVRGSGSATDPYVISGWDIDASGADGINVKDADAYFVIRDCYIHDGIANYNTGIYLENCRNGVITNNTCLYTWDGVYLLSSSDITVTDNNCSYDDGGVILFRSVNITLRNNTMFGNGMSVSGYNLDECNTHDIDTSNTVNGKGIYYYRDQAGVAVPKDAGQVILANCTGFVIEDHTFVDATSGVMMLFSADNTVRNNTFRNSVYGVYLWYSVGNTVVDNTCYNDAPSEYWWGGTALIGSTNNTVARNAFSDSSYGLLVSESSDGNAITDNSIFHNANGIYLQNSDHNSITRNWIHNNTQYGALVMFSMDNVIWNNTFFQNNGASGTYDPAHVQALETGIANRWNDTEGHGNHWSDWTAPDTFPPFGVVDSPYEIDGGTDSRDYYPLTSAPTEPIPEFSAMPLIVAALLISVPLARGHLLKSARTR